MTPGPSAIGLLVSGGRYLDVVAGDRGDPRGDHGRLAALLQQDGELGVIAVGAAGDLVVTDEDPLADIGVLAESRLAAVVQDGQVVDGEAAVG